MDPLFQRRALVAYSILYLTASLFAATPERSMVPFVGCRSDGQLGPQPAPRRIAKQLVLAPIEAQQLAYYQTKNGPGVLAPRGWDCFGTYGSNGSTIFVSPQPIQGKLLFSEGWKGFSGTVIELSDRFGGTSGRWAVASMVAHVFPAYSSFLTAVQKMGFDPSTTTFVPGPYKTDKLHYLNSHTVEYITPAHAVGVGTMSGLLAEDRRITGVQILVGADTDLISLSVRLSPEKPSLATLIMRQVEREYTEPPPRP